MERPWVTSASYALAIQIIVAVRKAEGLSQRDLAERLGKPRSFISKIESRERRLDLVEFIAVSRALEMDPVSLLTDVISALPSPLDF
jgi:transcriptional regulator with XRE-family HTH domain